MASCTRGLACALLTPGANRDVAKRAPVTSKPMRACLPYMWGPQGERLRGAQSYLKCRRSRVGRYAIRDAAANHAGSARIVDTADGPDVAKLGTDENTACNAKLCPARPRKQPRAS